MGYKREIKHENRIKQIEKQEKRMFKPTINETSTDMDKYSENRCDRLYQLHVKKQMKLNAVNNNDDESQINHCVSAPTKRVEELYRMGGTTKNKIINKQKQQQSKKKKRFMKKSKLSHVSQELVRRRTHETVLELVREYVKEPEKHGENLQLPYLVVVEILSSLGFYRSNITQEGKMLNFTNKEIQLHDK